ncbi:MAG: hypothetical protein ACRDQ2_17220 [Gaiellales bacterium]
MRRTEKTRILIATEPFSFRSALHAILALDPRFEVSLAPKSWNIGALDAGEEILLVSEPVGPSDRIVIRLSDEPTSVEVSHGGSSETLAYEGIASLIELLATGFHTAGPTPSTDQSTTRITDLPTRAVKKGG